LNGAPDRALSIIGIGRGNIAISKKLSMIKR